MANTFSLPHSFDDDDSSHDQATSPGGQERVRWRVVAKMPGLAPAQILVGRLQAEGIPSRAWQEGAGQALGLTVGLLGTGYVVVPSEFEEQARAILSDMDTWDEE